MAYVKLCCVSIVCAHGLNCLSFADKLVYVIVTFRKVSEINKNLVAELIFSVS